MKVRESVQIVYGESKTDPEYCDYQYGGTIKHIGVGRVEIEVKTVHGAFTIGTKKDDLKVGRGTHWRLLLLPVE
jgi:hypothetical protein